MSRFNLLTWSRKRKFIVAAEKELAKKRKTAWLKNVDEFLAFNSWDRTWGNMVKNIEKSYLQNNNSKSKIQEKKYV